MRLTASDTGASFIFIINNLLSGAKIKILVDISKDNNLPIRNTLYGNDKVESSSEGFKIFVF
jgi:hypothetical protein